MNNQHAYSEYRFEVPFENQGEEGYVSIHPEMAPSKHALSPTGRYFVYCLHPQEGTCTFIIEQDDNCTWISEKKPSFVADEFVDWVADRIEYHSK